MIGKSIFLLISSSLGFLIAIGSAFASDTSSNLWVFKKHTEESGALTITAEMLDIKHPPANYDPKAPGGFDDHGYGLDLTAPARLMFNSGSNQSHGMKFTAGYYRGPIYAGQGSESPFTLPQMTSTNEVSIFSNRDRSELFVAVDHGPIYSSTNSGMTWKTITDPGLHKFPLSTTPDGGGSYAHVPIDRPRSSPSVVAGTNAPIPDWYAVASSSDGSKVVVTASSSQPAPILNIRYSSRGATIAWPAHFTDFVLEHKSDLSGESWTIVTNPAQVVDGENRVVVPPSIGNDFFRLRGR
jgi:hypothetical protein